MISTAANPAHYGHHVWQDEDGETYYLAGHVPLRRAIAAANRYARVECGLVNLYDDSESPSGLPEACHVWWKPDPEDADSDWMLPASPDDPGAEPYTEVHQ